MAPAAILLGIFVVGLGCIARLTGGLPVSGLVPITVILLPALLPPLGGYLAVRRWVRRPGPWAPCSVTRPLQTWTRLPLLDVRDPAGHGAVRYTLAAAGRRTRALDDCLERPMWASRRGRVVVVVGDGIAAAGFRVRRLRGG